MKPILALLLAGAFVPALLAQPTALTYQGRLSDGGATANGIYDFQFVLRDAHTNQIGPTLLRSAVPVSDGTFSTMLDFGSGIFTGSARWLEIWVRTNGSPAGFTLLLPRQQISSAPYATHALTASNVLGAVTESQLPANIPRLNGNQQLTGAVTFNPLFGAPFTIGSTNTNRVAWLNADLLDGLDSAAFARSNHTHSALDITAGTLSDARLSANVPRLNDDQTFNGSNQFHGVLTATNGSNQFSGTFAGNGSSLTGLNANALSGVIPQASVPSSVAQLGENQTFSGTPGFNAASGAPFHVGNSVLVTNLNADLLDGFSASAFWNLTGNSNAAGTAFLGTVDFTPLELRANGVRAVRILPHALGANLTVGHPGNGVASNAGAAVILGGTGNFASNNYAAILGGANNRALGLRSAVVGGNASSATNSGAVAIGGNNNVAGGVNSLAAGAGAQALHASSAVWADGSSASPFVSSAANQFLIRAAGGVGIGTTNPQTALQVAGTVQTDGLKLATGAQSGAVLVSDAAGNATWQAAAVRALTNGTSPNLIGGHLSNSVAPNVVGATISGGGGAGEQTNFVGGNFGTIGGGAANRALGTSATIAGGSNNLAAGIASAVAGGQSNVASGTYAFVGGGLNNRAPSNFTAVVAGGNNTASGTGAVVGGGTNNAAAAEATVVAGGFNNRATNYAAVVSGGTDNVAGRNHTTVGGGFNNRALGISATVGGGNSNVATNSSATVPGGFLNVAGGEYSFAAGQRAQALHDGSFVWADDSTLQNFASTGPNQFLIRAAGGVGIGAAPVDSMLDVAGNVHVNDFDIFLRGGSDRSSGIGWYAGAKSFAGADIDGPVAYGWAHGALGTTGGGQRIALFWDSSRSVAIGGSVLPTNPLTVDGIGTLDGGAGVAEVTARFRNSLAAHTAVSIDAGLNRDAVLYFADNGAAHWGLRHDADDGRKFQLRYQFNNANTPLLTVTTNGNFGFGTTAPSETFHLFSPRQTVGVFQNSRTDGTWLGLENSGGGRRWNFISTGTANSEGAGHLLVHGNGGVRTIFKDTGSVGIGTVTPGDRLEVEGADAAIRIHNWNDGGLGGFVANTWGTLQLGMFSETVAVDKVPAGGKRSFLGLNAFGAVGSLNNNAGAPAWRNFLDDGNGNMSVNNNGSLNFGAATRQMLNLWNANYGIGVQNNTMYCRTDGNFAWYRNGNHVDTELSSGGGTELMRLNSGGLTVNGVFASSSDRRLKRDFARVNPREILHRVLSLEISKWSYTNDSSGARHIGPMAQDFHAAFHVGADNRHIASVDADGVALAAIQGLHAVVKERDARINELEKRLAAAESELQRERRSVSRIEERLLAVERVLASSTAEPRPGALAEAR